MDDVDLGLLQLKASLDHLAAQVAATEQRVHAEASAVKENLRSGQRLRARNCLRRQKRLNQSLEALLKQQNNLETVYEEILSAESNSKVVR